MIVNGQERADGLSVSKWRLRFSGLHDLEIEDAELMSLDRVVLFLVATRAGKYEVAALDNGDVRRTNVAAVSDYLILTDEMRERAISALANGTDQGLLTPPVFDGNDELQASQREVDRLAAFLIENYSKLGPGPESAVDMAIRLLDDARVAGVLNGTLGTITPDGEIVRPTAVEGGEELPEYERHTDPDWTPVDDGWDPRDLPERNQNPDPESEAARAAEPEPEPEAETVPEPEPEVETPADPAMTPPQNPPEPGGDDEEPGGPPQGEVVGHINDRSGPRDPDAPKGGRQGPGVGKFDPAMFDGSAPEKKGGPERVGVAYPHRDPILQRFMNEDTPR